MEVLKFFIHFVGISGTWQAIQISLLFPMCLTQDFRAHPILPNATYLWGWNVPTEYCTSRFGVVLDMSMFSIVGSSQKNVEGQSIIIFYPERLGYYPHIDSNKVQFGGIPQEGNLPMHLDQAKKDIVHYLPDDDLGLAIIDWQKWRPLWTRNWGPKEIYRRMSIEAARKKAPSADEATINKTAQSEFEQAGKKFMVETLKIAKLTRPKRYWGYYLFPDCYNSLSIRPDFGGRCSDIEKKRNDELIWLWNESTALYPSIYLNSRLKPPSLATIFARNLIQEAIRVSQLPNANNPLPVFVYTRPVFTDIPSEFLPEPYLVSTIGESVSLGASGNILWGSMNFSRSMEACIKTDNYMKNTLFPYMINVTLASKICSQVLCYSQGLCSRKNWDTDHYLHLNASSFVIEYGHCRSFSVTGEPSLADLYYYIDHFECRCFANATCTKRNNLENVDIIKVCVSENICVASTIKENLIKNRSRWKKKRYKTFSNISSSLSPATVLQHASGKDLNKDLKAGCSKEAISNSGQKCCQDANQVLIKFPVNILYALFLLYLVR